MSWDDEGEFIGGGSCLFSEGLLVVSLIWWNWQERRDVTLRLCFALTVFSYCQQDHLQDLATYVSCDNHDCITPSSASRGILD